MQQRVYFLRPGDSSRLTARVVTCVSSATCGEAAIDFCKAVTDVRERSQHASETSDESLINACVDHAAVGELAAGARFSRFTTRWSII